MNQKHVQMVHGHLSKKHFDGAKHRTKSTAAFSENQPNERTTTIARNLEKLRLEVIRTEARVNFLQECKKNNIIPRGMIIKSNYNIYKNNKLLSETMNKIRDNTLAWRLKQLRSYQINANTQISILKYYIDTEQSQRDHSNALSWMIKKVNKIRDELKIKHEKKLNYLIDHLKRHPSLSAPNNNNNKFDNKNTYVVNNSNKTLTEQQLNVLEKGLKYVPTPKSIDLVDIITNVETSLKLTPKILKQVAISEVTEFVQK
ncbi:unnamed protein product [Didymodactylos carnosus]|uniref:Uncharacterized protein n=1 Tax=Didymodactylos carnosus TaxID=1234261 RepID=A0A8S2F388_9BILA|nr:unnamed protein product [Didymodactylos carnosus]CAF4141568.1 unnamed protein product [Didymodactylos carnosus]